MRLPFKNHTIFAGYVGSDAPIRYLPSGEATVSARIIAKLAYRDEAGGYKTMDEWVTAVFYRKLAEDFAATGIGKGAFVHIEGRRHTRKWTDGRGYEKTAHEIIVSEWHQVAIPSGTDESSTKTTARTPTAQTPGAAPRAKHDAPAVKTRRNVSDLA